MEVTFENVDGIVVADAWKRIDGSNASAFEKALRGVSGSGVKGLVLDFSNLTYISSAGLRVILVAAKAQRKRNAKFAVCNLSRPVRGVFEVSGFDRIIAVHDSVSEALGSLSA